ncbi:MAG: DNA translocase FtsK 4TM domain-containing protein, partial [Planctomycetes bacterium]|nr:DNA translocase FtsK 4TM domain-containing protein [Planctomycetota bacterium]
MQRESRKEIAAFLVITLAAFVAICLFTRDSRDVLDEGRAIQNACGPAGALVAFHLTAWLGAAGAYGLTAAAGAAGLALLFRHRIEEWGWKAVGAALTILALSSLEVAATRGDAAARDLAGGYYGQFFYGFLLGHLSTAGTYLLLGFVLLVAFIVSTDTVLYPALARAGGFVLDADRWERAARGLGKHMPELRLPRLSLPWPRITWERKQAPAREPRRSAKRSAGEEPAAEGAAPAREEAPEPWVSPKKGRMPAPAEPVEGEGEPGAEAGAAEGGDEEDGGGAKSAPAAKPLERPPLKIREPQVLPAPGRRKPPERTKAGPYKLPPLELLDAPVQTVNPMDRTILEQTAAKIEETLRHFKIEARVVEVQKGPTITQYEVALAAGIKVHKLMNLADDLAMALKAPSIRIVAPIPGKSTVGVEVPNKTRSTVGLRELLEAQEFRDEDYNLPLALGKDVAGNPVIGDLGEMPHLLIAGSTGSGKSVCINSIIINLLLTRTPDEVKLILVDPKMVELAQFENIPHLLAPVVTDMKKAPAVLSWMVDKMEERYELFALTGVRHITAYNALGREKLRERLQGKVDDADMEDFPESLPFYVVIIDELADLMMTSSKEVEASITRLSQKSRAVGIHVILATQRPSVDVITGLIKA